MNATRLFLDVFLNSRVVRVYELSVGDVWHYLFNVIHCDNAAQRDVIFEKLFLSCFEYSKSLKESDIELIFKKWQLLNEDFLNPETDDKKNKVNFESEIAELKNKGVPDDVIKNIFFERNKGNLESNFNWIEETVLFFKVAGYGDVVECGYSHFMNLIEKHIEINKEHK